MEATNNKKEMIILRIYSILILIYSVFDVNTGILPKFFAFTIKPNTAFVNYFFTLTGIALYTTPINIIVGYGLLRRRFWARYGVIATMLTFPVILFTQYLYLGIFSLFQYGIYIQFFFVVLTLLFFTWKRVKVLFGEFSPFKLISWHGLLVFIIILFSFYSIFFSIFIKIKYNLPLSLYVAKPRVIILKKSNLSETPDKFLKVNILNTSLLIPQEFVIRNLHKTPGKDREWRVVFQNKGKEIRGIINLTNELPYGDEEKFRKLVGYRSKFDLEKYMLTNNWNPSVAFIRSRQQKSKIGDLIDFTEIHMDGYRGFWERRQTDILFSGGFSLYEREGEQFICGGYLLLKKYFDENNISTILPSIEFIKPEDPGRSETHYGNGLKHYSRRDILQAQIEFANAHILSHENPDCIVMFAKSLLLTETENYNYVKDLLNQVLKLKPEHKDAKKLLKQIESKLPKKVKK